MKYSKIQKSTKIYSSLSGLFLYHVYEFNHWQISGIRVLFLKYNHIQPHVAAHFRHVDVTLI